MFHYTTVDDAGLSRGYAKEIQLALDPFAPLSMYESHRRRRICRLYINSIRKVLTKQIRRQCARLTSVSGLLRIRTAFWVA